MMRLALLVLVLLGAPALAQTARQQPLTARETLLNADRAFSRLSERRGRAYAFLTMATNNARLFGADGVAPIYGRAQAFRALSRGLNQRMHWEPSGAGVSADGSMGWTDGRWQIAVRGKVAASGFYLAVWTRDRRSGWKVQALMNTSDPAAKK
jgi:hypothetical protein